MRRIRLIAPACLAVAAPGAAQDAITVADALRVIPSAAASGGETAASPATSPATWVTTADYPAWAAQNGVTGSVGLLLEVDISGRVAGCAIRQSSGVPDLDRVACEKVTERARFVPARDGQGNAVPGRWSTRVVWTAPERSPEPVPEPGQLVASMIVERDGSVSECTVELAKGIAAEVFEGGLCDDVESFAPILDASGKPERRRIRITTRIDHEPLP